jgi:hypothetical protein
MEQYENDLFWDVETDAEQNLILQIRKRIEQTDVNQLGRHLYILRLKKPLTRMDYHLFKFDQLQEIHRKLINGVSSLGSITNRVFFSKYFTGGVRLYSIQSSPDNEFPSFTIEYVLYSHYDNLDIRISKNLSLRVKQIDRLLCPIFEYVGGNTDLERVFPVLDGFELSEVMKNKLGYQLVGQIQNLEYQRPRFFGELFKVKKITL